MKIMIATKAKAAPTNTALKEFVSPIAASSFVLTGALRVNFLPLKSGIYAALQYDCEELMTVIGPIS